MDDRNTKFEPGDVVQVVDGPWLGRSGRVDEIEPDGRICVWLGHGRLFPPGRLKLISRGGSIEPRIDRYLLTPVGTDHPAVCKHGVSMCERCGITWVRDSVHTTDNGKGVVARTKGGRHG